MKTNYDSVDLWRFESRRTKKGPDECWEWTGSLFDKTGYGQFWINNTNVLVHRFAYLLKDPSFNQELQVLHSCDNRKCVNPDHLFLGTHSINMDDMVQKDRQASGECNGSSKLTEPQVLEMLTLRKEGYSQRKLARKFNISQAQVWNIVNNKNWTCLQKQIVGTEIA